MRILTFALAVLLATVLSHSRSLSSIRKDALTVGVSRSDSAAEYDFIADIAGRMKVPRFRVAVFDNANAGQKQLLEGKLDVIISRVHHSPGLEGRFLLSSPYGRTDVAVAVPTGSPVLTLSGLDGKPLAFVPRDVSGEQVLGVWKGSKPSAAANLDDAVGLLQNGTAAAVVASRQSLEARGDTLLRVFPNKLLENRVVALFAPGSKDLRDEFDRALATPPQQGQQGQKGQGKPSDREKVAKILAQMAEMRKELEAIMKNMK